MKIAIRREREKKKSVNVISVVAIEEIQLKPDMVGFGLMESESAEKVPNS